MNTVNRAGAAILTGIVVVVCGCKREAAAPTPSPAKRWSLFESARNAAPPSKVSIQSVALGTQAKRVHQLIGQPDFWGHLDTNFPGGYSLNTSYMTTGQMGPLPTTNHAYLMMGYPHSTLCWIYKLPGETAFLQFTNYRLADLSFGQLARMFDP